MHRSYYSLGETKDHGHSIAVSQFKGHLLRQPVQNEMVWSMADFLFDVTSVICPYCCRLATQLQLAEGTTKVHHQRAVNPGISWGREGSTRRILPCPGTGGHICRPRLTEPWKWDVRLTPLVMQSGFKCSLRKEAAPKLGHCLCLLAVRH